MQPTHLLIEAKAAILLRRPRNCRSRGAALLSALLTVSLVATLASAGLWRQWQAIEVERAQRERTQAAWLLRGAVDWARLILREDARATGIDHLGEPWAVPLQEARLGNFLAAEGGAVQADAGVADAYLSGRIIDLQSRLNVGNLIDNGAPSPAAVGAFERLFSQLGLPASELDTLVLRLQQSGQSSGAGAADAMQSPLLPQHESQLGWLGLSEPTRRALLPHVCMLPARTPLNLNTASAIVLRAAIAGLSATQAQRLVAARTHAPWRSVDEALAALAGAGALAGPSTDRSLLAVGSRYFRIEASLRQSTHTLLEEARVIRDNDQVRVIDRLRTGMPDQADRAEFYRGP